MYTDYNPQQMGKFRRPQGGYGGGYGTGYGPGQGFGGGYGGGGYGPGPSFGGGYGPAPQPPMQQPQMQQPQQPQYDNQADMMKKGKYKDSTGWHSADMGEGDQSVTNLTDTTQDLGSSLGRTLGAGVNVAYTGVKKVTKGVGGFFKKLFTGKNPFK